MEATPKIGTWKSKEPLNDEERATAKRIVRERLLAWYEETKASPEETPMDRVYASWHNLDNQEKKAELYAQFWKEVRAIWAKERAEQAWKGKAMRQDRNRRKVLNYFASDGYGRIKEEWQIEHLEERRQRSELIAIRGKGPRAVYCITNGTEYESASKAGEALGISRSSIVKVCLGTLAHTRRMVFAYCDAGVK